MAENNYVGKSAYRLLKGYPPYLNALHASTTMAVFTLETDYPSETGYLLDNSHHMDNTYILILDGRICPTLSICFSLNFDGF